MAERNYWLDLFTGKTWEEFLKSGAQVTGFRQKRQNIAKKIQVGDYFICYLTGVSRFVGILEVKSTCYFDDSTIWEDQLFPLRFKVQLLYNLDPQAAIPVKELSDKLSIFQNLKTEKSWSGFFRGSPTKFNKEDGEIITQAVKHAVDHPIKREYDAKKYWRRPQTFESSVGVVTVPDEPQENEYSQEKDKHNVEKITHEEIQYLLLKIGQNLGLDVWVARNDRNKSFNGHDFNQIKNLRKELPRQFDDATNRTIELIDVLWLQSDAIVAAFEVEHTSAIYSGLLRMSDLISMQPNLKIDLYIVGPNERRDKIFNEINRPTFSRLKPPLPEICKFIPYSELKTKVDNLGHMLKYIKPEFIDEIAEICITDDSY